jgi:hypothetical protein
MNRTKIEIAISNLEGLKNIPIYKQVTVDGDVKWWMTKFTKDQLIGTLDSCINILKSVKL